MDANFLLTMEEMALMQAVHVRIIEEMQKQDAEIRMLRRAVFGYADEPSFSDDFVEQIAREVDESDPFADEPAVPVVGPAYFLRVPGPYHNEGGSHAA